MSQTLIVETKYLISRIPLKAHAHNGLKSICCEYTRQKGFLASANIRRSLSDRADVKTRTISKDMSAEKQRIWTIPNILTSSRILVTPAIGYFIWHDMHVHALSLFTVAALTDLADGYIARNHANQSSEIGAILDPVADKLMLTTCFVSLYHTNLMPIWLIGSFILRDVSLLSGGALLRYMSFESKPTVQQYLDFQKFPAPNFEPTLVSKCNTALQCSLIVIHLAATNLIGELPLYKLFMGGLHALTASTTLASFGQYLFRARHRRTSFKINSKELPPRG